MTTDNTTPITAEQGKTLRKDAERYRYIRRTKASPCDFDLQIDARMNGSAITKPYWEQDIAECLRVAAEIIGPNSYYLRAAEYIDEMRAVNGRLIRELEGIAFFAPGNGDACEIIAKRARDALASIPASMRQGDCHDRTEEGAA